MAYLGTKPANQVIDSALIADGTITTNDLADNTITDAKVASVNYSKLTGTVPTWNQNTTGNAATATNASSADQAFEWKGSGSNTNWNTQFQDTLPASCTQIDINGGTSAPASGWWFAQSFRHANASSYWGTQYAHGWEDRPYQRWVRNVSNNSFGTWMLDSGCRTWVNFNGTGTVAIRASGNVSSITDNGTGDYTVNLVNALSDTNGAVLIRQIAQQGRDGVLVSYTTTAIRYQNQVTTTGSLQDNDYQMVAVFR